MPWFRVDDKLHDHRKSRKAGKSAMGVWVLAGSWSSDGFVPANVLTRWGNRADANRLVAAGLWFPAEVAGEEGWRFHDWSDFQPSEAVLAAWRAAESEAGRRGNHKRWHIDRDITDPECEFCYRVPDSPPDQVPDRVNVGSGIGSGIGSASPVPVPDPEPDVSSNEETSRRRDPVLTEPPREDVTRICNHLADRIAEDGSKRPEIGKGWRDAARLMLDKDGRTELDVHTAIDWCQNHDFWRSNILSMPKLRDQFDRLRKVAQSEQARPGSRADEWRSMQERQMARAVEREREMGLRQ